MNCIIFVHENPCKHTSMSKTVIENHSVNALENECFFVGFKCFLTV